MFVPTVLLRRLWPLLLLGCLLGCNLPRYSPAGDGATPASGGRPAGGVTPSAAPSPEASAGPATGAPAPAGVPDTRDVRIAYVKDGALWLWAGGTARQLTHQGPVFQPRLSPDGAWVAFLRPADDFHIELWVVGAGGAAEQRVVSIADLDTIGGGARDASAVAVIPARFAWLPDGQQVAFNTQQVYNGPGSTWLEDLHRASAAGEGVHSLFLPGWGGDFAFSPDGRQVALSQADEILLSQADGSGYRSLMPYTPVLTYSEYRYYAAPRWSPDGAFLRLALPPAAPLASPAQPTTLWKIPVGSPEDSPQQEGSLQPVPFFDTPVAYSPDLSRLAYIAHPDPDGQRQLHLATFDGQHDVTYAGDARLHWIGWAPDSRRLAYSLGDQQALWLGAVDGEPQAYAAIPSGAGELRWVDAGRFVVVRQQAEGFALLLADLSGQTLEIDTFTGVPPEFDVR